MQKTRRQYTREFKLEAVELHETSGKSATQIERELGIGTGFWMLETKLAKARKPFPDTGGSPTDRNASINWSVRLRSCARNEIS